MACEGRWNGTGGSEYWECNDDVTSAIAVSFFRKLPQSFIGRNLLGNEDSSEYASNPNAYQNWNAVLLEGCHVDITRVMFVKQREHMT